MAVPLRLGKAGRRRLEDVMEQLFTFVLPTLASTEALARWLAPALRLGDVLALEGDLGAGKTSFARALLHSLPGPGDSAHETVPSPTFTLLQTYDRDLGLVAHLDLYRLTRPQEALELGLEELLAEALVLLEWPTRLGALLPATALWLEFTFVGEGRAATLKGGGAWRERLQSLAPFPGVAAHD